MDLNEFRSFISDSGLDIWAWIDMSISVACADHENELRDRRDGIIQRLYAASSRCHNCDHHFSRPAPNCYFKEIDVAAHPKQDDYNHAENLPSGSDEVEGADERKKVLEIKILLDDQNQSDSCLIGLLQTLAGMRTTFKTLKETDIGRHVSSLRKHSSNEVRRLVKVLVRKWKDTVDEWVRLNTMVDDEDKKTPSPWIEGNIVISENTSVSCHFTPPKETTTRNTIESDCKSGSAKKRLNDQTFQETQHAKKQITSEYRNISKPKNNGAVQVNVDSHGGKYW